MKPLDLVAWVGFGVEFIIGHRLVVVPFWLISSHLHLIEEFDICALLMSRRGYDTLRCSLAVLRTLEGQSLKSTERTGQRPTASYQIHPLQPRMRLLQWCKARVSVQEWRSLGNGLRL